MFSRLDVCKWQEVSVSLQLLSMHSCVSKC